MICLNVQDHSFVCIAVQHIPIWHLFFQKHIHLPRIVNFNEMLAKNESSFEISISLQKLYYIKFL